MRLVRTTPNALPNHLSILTRSGVEVPFVLVNIEGRPYYIPTAEASEALGLSPWTSFAPANALAIGTPVAPPVAPARRQSARLRQVAQAEDRWEALRRLLCARAGQLEKTTGEDADDTRHRAAALASNGRTASSLDLTENEMEDAVTAVEHELYAEGFDFDRADAEYAERQAQRAALRLAA